MLIQQFLVHNILFVRGTLKTVWPWIVAKVKYVTLWKYIIQINQTNEYIINKNIVNKNERFTMVNSTNEKRSN